MQKPKALSRLWGTHNRGMLAVSFFVISVAICFLFLATVYAVQANTLANNIPTVFLPTTNQTDVTLPMQTKTGYATFDLPGNMHESYAVSVSCTVNSSFVQNNPSYISATLSFGPTATADLRIIDIEIEPTNAVITTWEFGENWTIIYVPFEPPMFSSFRLQPIETVGASEDWYGYDWQRLFFQDSGPIKLKITITAIPQESSLNYTIHDYWLTHWSFNQTVEISSLIMASSQSSRETQTLTTWQNQMLTQLKLQQANEERWRSSQEVDTYRNFSLTFFVLFFASIDIGVVIFDHSGDEDRKKEYENKHPKTE